MLERDTEANLYLHQLRLFWICADIDWEEKSATNFRLPKWSAGMESILKGPVSTRYLRLTNLLTTVFSTDPEGALKTDPFMTKMRMSVFTKQFVTALLQANFQVEPLLSLNQESNALNYLHFTKQVSDSENVRKARNVGQSDVNERARGIPEAQRRQQKSTIANLGRIDSMADVMFCAVNINGIARTLFDVSVAKPILYQIQEMQVETTESNRFSSWYAKHEKEQPHLPFAYVNTNQGVLNSLALFSKNAINIGIAESTPDTLDGLQSKLA